MIFFSCKKHKELSQPGGQPPPVVTPPPSPVSSTLLKQITVPNVVAPYFFEYDSAKRIKSAIVASGIRIYEVTYTNNRISEIRNNTMVNKDRLQYVYDVSGKVSSIVYIDEAGIIFRRAFFAYNGQQLIKIEWEVNSSSGPTLGRVMEMLYQPDGNVIEIKDSRKPQWSMLPGGYSTRFEQYDNKTNVDGFALIHDDIDHLLLLPGIHWQKNNPGRVIKSGDGLNTRAEYNYAYDSNGRPISRTGTMTITSGPNAGVSFPTNTFYSYY